MHRIRSSRGQAAVELVAVLPLAAVVCALVWQLVLAGHAAWSVASAARAAARAHAIGREPGTAARSALTPGLERGMKVETLTGSGGGVRVSVVIPSLTRVLKLGTTSASARFAPQEG